jgi:hypothetical protein
MGMHGMVHTRGHPAWRITSGRVPGPSSRGDHGQSFTHALLADPPYSKVPLDAEGTFGSPGRQGCPIGPIFGALESPSKGLSDDINAIVGVLHLTGMKG